MGPLFITVCLTLVVSTNYLFSNHLIKEPVTQNLFKLIYKVVRYAIKIKHSRQRSALLTGKMNLLHALTLHGKIKLDGGLFTQNKQKISRFFYNIRDSFNHNFACVCEVQFAYRIVCNPPFQIVTLPKRSQRNELQSMPPQ